MNHLSRRGVLGLAGLAGLSAAGLVGTQAFALTTATAWTSVNLRSGPSTSYGIITLIPSGATMTVTGSAQGSWTPVSYNGRTGWVWSSYITVGASGSSASSAPSSSGVSTLGSVKMLQSTTLRSSGSSSGASLGTVPSGAVVYYTGNANASYTEVVYGGKLGWVYSNYTIEIDPPFTQASAASMPSYNRRMAAVDYAMSKLGSPYVWAASGPSAFDCSGLTMMALRCAGVSLPHSSGKQAQLGVAVSRSNLSIGDLVFFYSPISHVGIYVGGGYMVHARNTTVDTVKQTVDSYISMGAGYNCARRYI